MNPPKEHPIHAAQMRVDAMREKMHSMIGKIVELDGRHFHIGESVTFQHSPKGKHYSGVVAGWTKTGKLVVIRTGTKRAYLFETDKLPLIHQYDIPTIEYPAEENQFDLAEVAKKHTETHQNRVDRKRNRYRKAS